MAYLNLSIQQQLDLIIEKLNTSYEKGDYKSAIQLAEEAWSILPDPKGSYDESYHIAKDLIKLSLKESNLVNAKKWSKIIYECDLERIDSGERDFYSGVVMYEMGELDVAKKYFLSANIKSDGRCFEGEDKKYLDLIS